MEFDEKFLSTEIEDVDVLPVFDFEEKTIARQAFIYYNDDIHLVFHKNLFLRALGLNPDYISEVISVNEVRDSDNMVELTLSPKGVAHDLFLS